MLVTLLVSNAGTLVSLEQLVNMSLMSVTLLVSNAGTPVRLEQL